MIKPDNMKKSLLLMLTLSIIVSSCKKDSSSQTNGGSWTFNAATYQAASCVADSQLATLTAVSNVSGSPFSNIVVSFYHKLPDSTATYIVAREGNLSPGHLSLSVAYHTSTTTTYYTSVVGNGNQKASVTVTNGKISVSGTNIEILNLGGNTDSTRLSFNITQTQ
jgi:hypothetical protein